MVGDNAIGLLQPLARLIKPAFPIHSTAVAGTLIAIDRYRAPGSLCDGLRPVVPVAVPLAPGVGARHVLDNFESFVTPLVAGRKSKFVFKKKQAGMVCGNGILTLL